MTALRNALWSTPNFSLEKLPYWIYTNAHMHSMSAKGCRNIEFEGNYVLRYGGQRNYF
jgi:hypothetical protein